MRGYTRNQTSFVCKRARARARARAFIVQRVCCTAQRTCVRANRRPAGQEEGGREAGCIPGRRPSITMYSIWYSWYYWPQAVHINHVFHGIRGIHGIHNTMAIHVVFTVFLAAGRP